MEAGSIDDLPYYDPKWTPEPMDSNGMAMSALRKMSLSQSRGSPSTISKSTELRVPSMGDRNSDISASSDTNNSFKDASDAYSPLMFETSIYLSPPTPTSSLNNTEPTTCKSSVGRRISTFSVQSFNEFLSLPKSLYENIYRKPVRAVRKMKFSDMDPYYHMASLENLNTSNVTSYTRKLVPGFKPELTCKIGKVPKDQLILANGQPKEIPQLEKVDWKSDEHIMESNAHCILSILAHIGVVIFGCVLLWRLYLFVWGPTDAQKAEKNLIKKAMKDLLLIVSSTFLCLFYALHLVESYGSLTLKYFDNFVAFEDFIELFESFRFSVPRIYMKLKMDTINLLTLENEVQQGSIGSEKKTRKIPKINVNNEKISFEIPIKNCIDISGELLGPCPGDLTRIDLMKTFGFVSARSAATYDKLLNSIRSNQQLKDENESFPEMELPNFSRYSTVYFRADGEKRFRFMTKSYFWIFTAVMFTWPYRWWFRFMTQKVRFSITKLIEVEDSNAD